MAHHGWSRFHRREQGELRPRTPASGAAVMVSHGSSLMVVCFKRREEELAFCMAGINQWREPSSLAAVEALRLCRSAPQQVFIWTDCMFVVNGFARGRRRRHLSHADLWEELWKARDAIGPPVSFHQVWRSHATEAEIAAGLISPMEAYVE